MIQHIIRQSNSRSLHIFFAGWGMDPHPFTALSAQEEDLMICYDYTDMTFDLSLLHTYDTIRLTAWSMGVRAAAVTFGNTDIRFTERTAVNGTMTPVHDTKGIPCAVFEGTLHSLSPKNLERFNRRMCNSDKELIAGFSAQAPQRDIESLREELAAIGNQAVNTTPDFQWDKVIIGENDLIFPFINQQNAWRENGNVVILPIAHYARFDSIL
ncbi:MAG: DUF452 family protein [Bacteroidales bacterium]